MNKNIHLPANLNAWLRNNTAVIGNNAARNHRHNIADPNGNPTNVAKDGTKRN
jgi:hypothetical protein